MEVRRTNLVPVENQCQGDGSEMTVAGSPVTVREMFTLNVSASMTCTPELGPVGERRVVIA